MVDRYKVDYDVEEGYFKILDSFCQNDLVCFTYNEDDADNIVELLNLQDKGWLKIVMKEVLTNE